MVFGGCWNLVLGLWLFGCFLLLFIIREFLLFVMLLFFWFWVGIGFGLVFFVFELLVIFKSGIIMFECCGCCYILVIM